MNQAASDSGSDTPETGGHSASNAGATGPPTQNQGAYLILRSAGRWSDVFRLAPPSQASQGRNEAVIGRASSNQIVIRNDQASRRHAKIYWESQQWLIDDLGSRNGTFVNGQRIESAQSLTDGDVIEIAGFAIQFTKRIDGATSDAGMVAGDSSQATDDQLTMEVDPESITDRRRHSHYLQSSQRPSAGGQASVIGAQDGSARRLLQLAFTLARADQASVAIEEVLDRLAEVLSFNTAGAYVTDPKKVSAAKSVVTVNDLVLSGTRQSGARSYRRPPDSLVATVAGPDGQAVLARNVIGDRELATENSRGEIDVESVILAPVRDRDDRVRGLLHLTTTAGQAPLGPDELEFVVAAAEILAESLAGLAERKHLDRSLKRSRQQIKLLQEQLSGKVQIIGRSEVVGNVVEQVALVAPTNATVLIRGESGVGKELIAAAIHHASPRRDAALICLNCAALSPTLLESELFGHEKGAFTGATDRKQGKFEAADGGTLMLDEIGEMSAEIQAKFLRVLEGHPFERVGGQAPIKVDVRVVAATNRDLQKMVAEGKFRQDLFYRLHVVEIVVPPLRKRGKDVLSLAEYFLQAFNREMGRKIEGLTEAAQKRLLEYSWPGNVRELRNVIERAVVLNTKSMIDADDLSLAPAVAGGKRTASTEDDPTGQAVHATLAELERQHIERVLRHTGGNKSRASTMLGIERSTLDRKLKKFAKNDES
ncbi:MAG: sigma 54-interacting transcriptional regulator [Pirellulaceae bacterium]|nr:sigma 54-interacting transcriptional regulator [Pirellulaceae bacterium]